MDFRELEKSIGYKFKNYKLLEESTTHKSINSKLNYENNSKMFKIMPNAETKLF